MAGVVTAAGVLGLVLTWWAHPVDQAVNAGGETDWTQLFKVPRIEPELFVTRGIVPIGYAAIALAIGALAGAVVRRTVPAMAIALAAYVVIQIVMPTLVRPHLVEAAERTTPIAAGTLHGFTGSGPNHVTALDVSVGVPGAWVLSSHTIDAHGDVLRAIPGWFSECLPLPGTGQERVGPREQACFDRLAREGYRQRTTYQPAGHYWALQWRETGVLLAGAALLAGASLWRVRRVS
jgi:hypothetical protein